MYFKAPHGSDTLRFPPLGVLFTPPPVLSNETGKDLLTRNSLLSETGACVLKTNLSSHNCALGLPPWLLKRTSSLELPAGSLGPVA